LHNKCASLVKAECSLGEFANMVLPPTVICPAVLDRQKSINYTTSRGKNVPSTIHFQITATENICPLLVFINPKSGGRQGDRILRKFQYLLNPRQVYDLSKGGPLEGLTMFKDVPNFMVICCGGDGTVGWVLEAMDSIELQCQPSVGVIPLGTGNDLARCLRWGGGYEGESIPKILDKIQRSSVVMLDRWSIEVKNHPTIIEDTPIIPTHKNVQKVIELSHRIIVEKSVIQSYDESKNSTKTTEISIENTKRVVLSDNNGTATTMHQHQHQELATATMTTSLSCSSSKEITQQTTNTTSNGDIGRTLASHSETVVNGTSQCEAEVINGDHSPSLSASSGGEHKDIDGNDDKTRAVTQHHNNHNHSDGAKPEEEDDEKPEETPAVPQVKEKIVDLPKLIKPQAASEFTVPYNIVNNYFSVGVSMNFHLSGRGRSGKYSTAPSTNNDNNTNPEQKLIDLYNFLHKNDSNTLLNKKYQLFGKQNASQNPLHKYETIPKFATIHLNSNNSYRMNFFFPASIDAAICVKFHLEREKNPHKFNSRMKNKLWYFEYATSETFAASCKNLHESLEIVCDGVSLELANGPQLQGIALLNIPYTHGGSNLWGENLSQKRMRKGPFRKKLKNSDKELSANSFNSVDLSIAIQDIGDRRIEVIGLENCLHMGQVRTGLRASGRRLAQCSEVVLTTKKTFPMQIDGEPWMQGPCT
ncbi:AAEL013034-PA, partial [Aedes aegypti]